MSSLLLLLLAQETEALLGTILFLILLKDHSQSNRTKINRSSIYRSYIEIQSKYEIYLHKIEEIFALINMVVIDDSFHVFFRIYLKERTMKECDATLFSWWNKIIFEQSQSATLLLAQQRDIHSFIHWKQESNILPVLLPSFAPHSLIDHQNLYGE